MHPSVHDFLHVFTVYILVCQDVIVEFRLRSQIEYMVVSKKLALSVVHSPVNFMVEWAPLHLLRKVPFVPLQATKMSSMSQSSIVSLSILISFYLIKFSRE